MVADVKSPDLEHRIAILRKKQQQDHLETPIPDDVLRYCRKCSLQRSELEGCIIKLLLYASLRHREISIDLAREALADKIRRAKRLNSGHRCCRPSNGQEVVARPGA